MTQNTQILAALERGPLTQLQALSEVGCMRLAARVHDLRLAGHTIVSEKVYTNGKTFARYRLVRKDGR